MDARSEKNLVGVHPDLVRVVRRAAEAPLRDFIVTDGRRTTERQMELYLQGKTRTLRSRHLTGHAVDLAVRLPGGGVSWLRPDYEALAKSMKAAAADLGIPLTWGGDWQSFVDSPHFELPRNKYPEEAT